VEGEGNGHERLDERLGRRGQQPFLAVGSGSGRINSH
jgi:hypothetical protein